MNVVGCLLLMYLAAVARAMQGQTLGLVDASAIAVVVAVRWCSPAVAAVLACLMGLLLDGMSAGPFGAHAAAAVVMAAMLSRWNSNADVWPIRRWVSAILLMVCANTLVIAWDQAAPSWQWADGKQLLILQAATAAATALFVGVLVSAGRFLSGAACATR